LVFSILLLFSGGTLSLYLPSSVIFLGCLSIDILFFLKKIVVPRKKIGFFIFQGFFKNPREKKSCEKKGFRAFKTPVNQLLSSLNHSFFFPLSCFLYKKQDKGKKKERFRLDTKIIGSCKTPSFSFFSFFHAYANKQTNQPYPSGKKTLRD
jgi:hypothetical protein